MAPVHYQKGRFPPDERLDWSRLIPLIGPTAAALARYDGMLAAIPNPSVLLAPLSTQEAVLSSRIEGTQATMADVLKFEAGYRDSSTGREDDIEEIINYRRAMERAEEMLETLPLSQRVLREAHRTLLDGVRGDGMSPGAYRRVPNWIGPSGCTMDDATFVPAGAELLPDAVSAWERYIHRDFQDRLVQVAVLHAEFEAMHPFLDGNGRLGRMIIPLLLRQYGLITEPIFYISPYLEARRDAYYDRLLAVSRDDDWTGWCQFFLNAVRAQAEENLAKTKGILDLYEEMKKCVPELIRSQHTILALDWIFRCPIFSNPEFSEIAKVPPHVGRRIFQTLCDYGILDVIDSGAGRRAAIYVFSGLMDIVEDGVKLE